MSTCANCGWEGTPGRLPRHSCDRQRTLAERAARVAARKKVDGPRRDCTHAGTPHIHGHRVTYVLDQCRCRPCRDANRTYAATRTRQRAYGRQAYVDATSSRQHVQTLQAAGMGYKRIAAAAGVSTSAVSKLLFGDTEKVRPVTEQALLAVRLDLADGSHTDGAGTARRLQALVAAGWSQSRLAHRLGWTVANLAPVVHGRRAVTAATAAAVRALFDELWDTPPPTATRWQVGAAANARRVATAHGWVPALAWDEGAIDDPAVVPAVAALGIPAPRRPGRPALKVHLDDVEWLLEQGEHPDAIATRMAVTRGALTKAAERADRQDLRDRLRLEPVA